MFGPRSPHEVLELLDIGIDIFDSSYPIIQAQKNCAVTFHIPELETLSSPSTRKPAHDVLDVSDESNRLLFEPLLEGCQCYTCDNHTKAYIYHLISVKELLAPILLTLHNLHRYFKFFDVLRQAITVGKYDEFKSEMLSSNFVVVPPKNSNGSTWWWWTASSPQWCLMLDWIARGPLVVSKWVHCTPQMKFARGFSIS